MDYAPQRAQLESRLNDLLERLRRVESELEAPHSKDWAEMATEREGDEVLEGLGRSGDMEIQRIRAALMRMDAGEYGICIRCGEEVSKDRLQSLPETPLCRDCATKV
jgi:RNA polymerase-binding transcription factor DksA